MGNNTSFKPGQTGNPKGRTPKDQSMTHLLKEFVKKKGPDSIPHRQKVVEKIVALAETGSIAAIREIFDRIDGKPIQKEEVTGSIEYTITPPIKPDDLDYT